MGLGGDSVEDLYMRLIVKHEGAADSIRTFVTESKKQIGGISTETDKAQKSFIDLGAVIQTALGVVAGNAVTGLIGLVGNLIAQVPQLIQSFIAGGVQINATMQQMTISLSAMLGSADAATAMINRMREKAAVLGQDPMGMIMAARSLLPYLNGNIDALDKTLTLAQQLAVLDPYAGIKGANRALREAFSGNMRTLQALFELPRGPLNEIQRQLRETGDTDAFVASLQELVGQFGVSTASIEEMAKSFTGQINIMKFHFMDLQRIATAPLFGAMQEALGKFSALFNANFGSMKEMALSVGATIAVVFEIMVEGITMFTKGIIDGVAAWKENFKQLDLILQLISKSIENAVVKTATDAAMAFVNAVNFVLQKYNQVAAALNLPEIEVKEANRSELESRFRANFQDIMSSFDDMISSISTNRKGAIDVDLFPNFGKRVQEYIAQFQYLLSEDQSALEDLNVQRRTANNEELEEQLKHLNQIRDVLEDNYKAMQEASANHFEKMAQIEADAAEKRNTAYEKYNEDIAEANNDYAEQSKDAKKTHDEDVEKIEEDHQEKLKQIAQKAQDELFDAVNARDARRVYEILRTARQETTNADKEKEKQLRDSANHYKEEQEKLKIARDRRIATIEKSLIKELTDIQKNMEKQRAAEVASYSKRLQDLNNSLQQKLYQIGKAWADEGKMDQQGLSTVITQATGVFGPNGAYLSLYAGFNNALMLKVAETNQILKGIEEPSVSGGTSSGGTSGGSSGGTGKITYAAAGFEGVVREPSHFIIAEGGPERVSIIPEGRPGYTGNMNVRDSNTQVADGGVIKVLVEARGVTPEFEAQVAEQVATMVGGVAVARRKRGRSR